MENKRKIVIVGASYRAMHGFINNIQKYYGEQYEIAGVSDLTIDKVEDLNSYIDKNFKAYNDFDLMLAEVRPDVAVIANIDCVHVDYLEKTLAAGVRSVVEKPLCVDAKQSQRVRDAIRKYPNIEAVTAHNMRYHPASLKIKEVLDSGRIGKVRSINFTETLDVDHGASYFQRWNRTMNASGGLLIHKSSHHFDMLNWFIGSYAKNVSAHGDLLAYGENNCPFDKNEIADNCHKCQKTKEECRYRTELTGPRYYLHKSNLEKGDYTPDLCVFSPDIDITDHVSVGIRYKNGVHACYTLCAHSAVESMRVEIEGTIARLEYEVIYSSDPNISKSEGDLNGHYQILRVIEFGKPVETVKIPEVKGSHGGADLLMCKDLFGGESSDSKATLEDGLQAVLIGIAANESMRTGKVVELESLEKQETFV